MKIICLNDKYKPQDRVSHGKVKCFDQSGNKVFDNSNMIVATGRSAIRNQCFTNILQSCEIYIGNTGTTPTNYGMTFSKTGYEKIGSNGTSKVIGAEPVITFGINKTLFKDGQDTGITVETDENGKLVVNGEVTENDDTPENRKALVALVPDPTNPDFVRIVINIPPRNDYKEISDLCIVQSTGELFSRVCFDRIPLDNNNGYILIYFIYF